MRQAISSLNPLSRSFYAREPTYVAKSLIGKYLLRKLRDGTELGGVIVETEAYGGHKDPASHAYKGRTRRNEVMFGEAGHAYVYFTYGFHHCLNFVTGKKGIASAVLIRALEPVSGIQIMQKFRGKAELTDLASGPGKLCQALNIDRALNGCDITNSKSPIRVIDRNLRIPRIRRSIRIGIRTGTERKWRFFAESSRYVSKFPKSRE